MSKVVKVVLIKDDGTTQEFDNFVLFGFDNKEKGVGVTVARNADFEQTIIAYEILTKEIQSHLSDGLGDVLGAIMKDIMGVEDEGCDGDCEHCDHPDKEFDKVMAGMRGKMGGDLEDLISRLRRRG